MWTNTCGRGRPRSGNIEIILLDIEGTTTPIDFVYQTLFPYARTNFPEWLRANLARPDIQADIAGLREEHDRDPDQPRPWDESNPLDSALTYLLWLMDRDRKSTALKSLQGKIWEEGYSSGELSSEIYPDVKPAMEDWKRRGLRIAIYSSGSVLAQKLLFGHTTEGDLTPLIDAWFDTRIGAKREVESYRRIADSLGIDPAEILFVSDVTAELDAAQKAGMMTALSIRPGNPPQPDAVGFQVIRSFAAF
ncbi:MAG: acireductone synthase [Acidobacteriota bacterium]|nr:MAG: acireductone synthase [Acidobacteriota bacterium]